MTDIVFIVLLFIHIATVILWMGASVLFVSVLAPSITKFAASSKADFFKNVGPRYMRYVGGVATVAVADGLVLYSYVAGYITPVSSSVSLGSSGMPWILVGILLGLSAYVVGIGVVLRSTSKLVTMMSQAPPDQAGGEQNSGSLRMLQRRIAISSRLQATLLVLALIMMVIGANA